ncbi:MAG: endolytic transglycosylase MltG [Mollicutes bacterium]|nr:endolytic transglycosylase MltG [Mollicutes bacterium]
MTIKVKPRPLLLVVLLAVILLILGISWVYLASPVDKNDKKDIEVEITKGISVVKISNILKEEKLIRSKTLFKVYIKLYSNKTLKAGNYMLNRSMSLSEIVEVLEEGSKFDSSTLKLTFKEGQRITDYAKVVADSTNNNYEDVIAIFKDKNYMSELINKYWFLTNNILQDGIYYPLEGYLAPDTYYFKDSDVDTKEIIERMLDEMNKELTEYRVSLGNNVHYYLTMASIVELEGKTLEDRQNIMGVFNNRISAGMHLGSDVTTYYAFQASMSTKLTSEQYNTTNPYNTRPTSKVGPPIGPICNPDLTSIQASINPINNNYLYFVADSNGKVYYSRTIDEQNKVIQDLISSGKWNG